MGIIVYRTDSVDSCYWWCIHHHGYFIVERQIMLISGDIDMFECDDCGYILDEDNTKFVTNWLDGGYSHYCEDCALKPYAELDQANKGEGNG